MIRSAAHLPTHLFLAAAVAALAASPSAAQQHGTGHAPEKNLVETAVEAGSFSTLAAALQAAGLVETLSSGGPFTVFAPTDAAFAKLPAGTLEALLQDKERLASILTFHVIPGRVTAAQVVELDSATTVQGQDVDIEVRDGVVRVNGATVTATDVLASNGVIHVIDRVMLPTR